MRFLLKANIPVEAGNAAAKAGKLGTTIQSILADLKPEAVYFTEQGGERSAILVIEIGNPSEAPKFAEPFFLNFNAKCQLRIAMSPDDLKKAGLEALGKKWA
jgi:hypothetical protein